MICPECDYYYVVHDDYLCAICRMPDGEYTGRWVEKKVTGKWARTDRYLVGPTPNKYQYILWLEGYKAIPYSLWGKEAVRHSLVP